MIEVIIFVVGTIVVVMRVVVEMGVKNSLMVDML